MCTVSFMNDLKRARSSGLGMMTSEVNMPARLKVLLGAMQVMVFCAMSSDRVATGVCL